MRAHIQEEPEISPVDLAVYWATHGDPLSAAELIRPGFVTTVADAGLRDDEAAALRGEMLKRGLALVVEGGDLFAVEVEEIVGCVWCREDHAIDDSHAACSGAVPLDEIDGIDTDAQCSSCLHAVQGPPAPYCCGARQRLIEALHGDEAMRIKQCPLCHGTGVLSHGVACDRCGSTGVAGVR